MRIVAGEWRGRKLVAPAGVQTRPTADRTRETLFSMLASRLGGFDLDHDAGDRVGDGQLFEEGARQPEPDRAAGGRPGRTDAPLPRGPVGQRECHADAPRVLAALAQVIANGGE